MTDKLDPLGLKTSRRSALKCGLWAGAGILWEVSGGVPRALGLERDAEAATGDFIFAQVSDSHLGFKKQPNPDSVGTFREAIRRIEDLPVRPAFLIHTGDVSQLSKPAQFATAADIIGGTGLEAHFLPGEHDILDEDGSTFFEHFPTGAKTGGWYSFDHSGIHFVVLVNVFDFKAGGFGQLGTPQLEWLKSDLQGHRSSTPIVVFTHIPLWMAYAKWGWGTVDGEQALSYLKRFGSVTVLNGHIHQVLQKVEGHVSFHTAMSTAFPQPAPGTAQNPGPLKVPPGQLRSTLGITSVYLSHHHPFTNLADVTLAS